MDNELANFVATPMAIRHFEITSRELISRKYPQNVVQSVRAVLVDRANPIQASTTFRVSPADLLVALRDYSQAWAKYCADNGLVHNAFWLPPNMIPRAKAAETRELNRAERKRKEKAHDSEDQNSSA